MNRPGRPSRTFDTCAVVPIAAIFFALIGSPILIFAASPEFRTRQDVMELRPENRIFWPAMIAIAVLLVVKNRHRLGRVSLSPHIVCLFAYLAFAGLSALWAFSPASSFTRFVQQAMIVTSIVLPTMWAARSSTVMRGLFLCFAFAVILNAAFVLGGSVTLAHYDGKLIDIGYQGYFLGKNYLGECGVVALLLSFHEMFHRGWRRVLAIVVLAAAVLLVFLSDSKTALALALIAPLLAIFTLAVRKITRVSPAIILLSIPICWVLLSSVSNFNMNRISYMLYGDSTLTGRSLIWDFVQLEIARRPLLGWGYQSYWLVPGSPALADASNWVKYMPNAHNGYYDTMLEMGYVGLALLLAFILATLHAIGRVADRDPARARLMLSLALFVILYNFLESLWMRGFEFLWVVFVIVAADAGRYWRPTALRGAAYGLSRPAPRNLGRSPGVQMPRPGIGLS